MKGQWIKKRTCGGVGENKVAETRLAFGSVFVGGVLPSCLIATCFKLKLLGCPGCVVKFQTFRGFGRVVFSSGSRVQPSAWQPSASDRYLVL